MIDSRYRKESDEVYYCNERVPTVQPSDIAFLKARAAENWRLRCRLCLHSSPLDPLQDMIIVFHEATYFRPLRHVERPQLFHLLEGTITLVLLDDNGAVVDTIELSSSEPGRAFETLLQPGVWYSFVLHSQWLVIRETTTGPMTATDRQYAPFAPEEGDPIAREYAADLKLRAQKR
ncbi:MAG TPA: WbuC family cupin fold metalloprotein [Candidatus Cybelea sp.]|nr:WbuC family cupin fold metalloprotein [Candidatus Cybelea sp.]